MLDVSKDIHSLTEFKTKTPVFLEELREVGRALLLTVNGRAEIAVMGAATFQKVLEAMDTLDALRGIREGLDDVKAGRTRPANEFFAELSKKFPPCQGPAC
jgi:PHD/YefM family antitoxin component YafN of YafNO toxin-antitoxin module